MDPRFQDLVVRLAVVLGLTLFAALIVLVVVATVGQLGCAL